MKTGNYEERVSLIREAIELQSPRSAYFEAMVSAVHGHPVAMDNLETRRQIEYVNLLKEIAATEPNSNRGDISRIDSAEEVQSAHGKGKLEVQTS